MCQLIAVAVNIQVDAVDYVLLCCSGISFCYCNDETGYKIVQQNSWKGPFLCLSKDMVLSV